MKFGIFVYDRFWPLLGVKWSKRPAEKLLPSVRNIKVPDDCQNNKSLLGKFNILWPNAIKQYFVGQKGYTLCKTTFWEAVTQPFVFFFARRGFHRDPRTIIQYKDLDAPDDADAF